MFLCHSRYTSFFRGIQLMTRARGVAKHNIEPGTISGGLNSVTSIQYGIVLYLHHLRLVAAAP